MGLDMPAGQDFQLTVSAESEAFRVFLPTETVLPTPEIRMGILQIKIPQFPSQNSFSCSWKRNRSPWKSRTMFPIHKRKDGLKKQLMFKITLQHDRALMQTIDWSGWLGFSQLNWLSVNLWWVSEVGTVIHSNFPVINTSSWKTFLTNLQATHGLLRFLAISCGQLWGICRPAALRQLHIHFGVDSPVGVVQVWVKLTFLHVHFISSSGKYCAQNLNKKSSLFWPHSAKNFHFLQLDSSASFRLETDGHILCVLVAPGHDLVDRSHSWQQGSVFPKANNSGQTLTLARYQVGSSSVGQPNAVMHSGWWSRKVCVYPRVGSS